jgi:hypothetical protein
MFFRISTEHCDQTNKELQLLDKHNYTVAHKTFIGTSLTLNLSHKDLFERHSLFSSRSIRHMWDPEELYNTQLPLMVQDVTGSARMWSYRKCIHGCENILPVQNVFADRDSTQSGSKKSSLRTPVHFIQQPCVSLTLFD